MRDLDTSMGDCKIVARSMTPVNESSDIKDVYRKLVIYMAEHLMMVSKNDGLLDTFMKNVPIYTTDYKGDIGLMYVLPFITKNTNLRDNAD